MSILSRKFLPPFLGVATLAWIVGGTFWFNNQYCDAPAAINAVVSVKNTEPHLPFYFNEGAAQPIFTTESFSIFKETADFLNDNRHKTLIIKGLYAPQEAKFTNLGLERAKAIKSALLNLGAMPTSIETKSEKRTNLYFVNQQLFDGVEFNMVDIEDGRFQALNLFFQKNKYQFADNNDLKNYFHALNAFLSEHPNVKLKITAHRDNTEGVTFSKKRLAFMFDFLKNHDFLPKQFEFADKGNENPLAEVGQIKNRRVEIRLIVP